MGFLTGSRWARGEVEASRSLTFSLLLAQLLMREAEYADSFRNQAPGAGTVRKGTARREQVLALLGSRPRAAPCCRTGLT